MTRSAEAHTTFVIERTLPATPESAFAAWATKEMKESWSSCHTDAYDVDYGLDFRIGGSEHNRARENGRDVFIYEARFLDIVENDRIIYAYDMLIGAQRVSCSLVTVTFRAAGSGTLMTFTEQAVFLDAHADDAHQRQAGTEDGFDRLEAVLSGLPVGVH